MLFASSPLQLLLLLLLNKGGVLGDEVKINTPKELIDFSNNVNIGTSYSGATVYLGSDLDFSSSLSQGFAPIGSSTTFQGTFDGKGHVIRNLTLDFPSLPFVGLFGLLNEATIKNVVLDASCSVVSSYDSDSIAGVGSIAGTCNRCTIENIVNMASVTFIGNTFNNDLNLGGIAGRILNSNTIRNCVNYGSATYSGITSITAYVGGITGHCDENSGTIIIQNCANYGTIIHNGTTTNNLYMGGIVGANLWETVNIENCLSAGKILNLTSVSGSNAIGSVVGYSLYNSATSIAHCMWTSEVGYDAVYKTESATVTISYFAELNITTMNDLNSYAEKDSTWDKWFMLHLNGGTISNDISQEALIVTQKYFPDPVKEGRTFLYWCTNTECTEKYDPNTTDITKITDLYAIYSTLITFDFGNGTKVTKNVIYEKYGALPDAGEKEGYTFNGWFTEENGNGEEISSDTTVSIISDHTLYAHWTVNNYTLTLNFGNGTEATKNVTYGEAYGTLPVPEWTGHTFNGWFTDPTDGDKIESTSIVNTSDHHTIYPHWAINQYTITFEANGGNACENITQDYGTSIELPTPKKTGYTFSCWCSDSDLANVFEESTIPAEDMTLYAKWDINNYTLTFIFNNGESDEVRILNYSENIEYPNDPVKEGYIFNGWDKNVTIMPANNLNITALWTLNKTSNSSSGFVEIVFGKKDLSKEEIEAIISEYTDEKEFVIEKIEVDEETGGIKVIIKFIDKEVAENFVETVKASSNFLIKDIIYLYDQINSFSTSLYPVSFMFSFFSL